MFHALPRAGGVLDQPAGLLRRMKLCRDYVSARQMTEGVKEEKDAPSWAWDLLFSVESERIRMDEKGPTGQ